MRRSSQEISVPTSCRFSVWFWRSCLSLSRGKMGTAICASEAGSFVAFAEKFNFSFGNTVEKKSVVFITHFKPSRSAHAVTLCATEVSASCLLSQTPAKPGSPSPFCFSLRVRVLLVSPSPLGFNPQPLLHPLAHSFMSQRAPCLGRSWALCCGEGKVRLC